MSPNCFVTYLLNSWPFSLCFWLIDTIILLNSWWNGHNVYLLPTNIFSCWEFFILVSCFSCSFTPLKNIIVCILFKELLLLLLLKEGYFHGSIFVQVGNSRLIWIVLILNNTKFLLCKFNFPLLFPNQWVGQCMEFFFFFAVFCLFHCFFLFYFIFIF